MDAQTYDDLKQRVLGAIQDYASSVPEDDESWESWFHAAFDMAAKKVSAVLESSHPAEQDIREGWKVVPINPTEHMLDVGACYEDPEGLYTNHPLYDEGDLSRDVYKAMIGAAIKD